ncbi:paraquat-inducible protein A [Paracoccus aerodenitrificans]|uniref:paraquat-inducible protein A n=1 Tax=Paracoccus aerodenitrificans TaxID=3017781 RepID=UPI0022F0611E|nr:paraquat-inducible protein A [Paracoccus aerodenitrificans]WBU63871.1 paraquat-inducible protein A [Paracoccus aerodenitrificans]
MKRPDNFDLSTGEGLVACPRCDALHIEEELADGETVRCIRCGGVLARPQAGAFTQIIALAITTMVLMFGAIFFPFLEISRMGLGHGTSLFGVAMAFSDGPLAPLTIALLATIVGLPALRSALLLYTLLPLARGKPAYSHAVQAFRLSEQLKPWSMAEIFVIGTAVAMVKVAGLATISFGPAFWAFCALIFVNIANRSFMCSTTIWDAIEDSGAATDGREQVEAA